MMDIFHEPSRKRGAPSEPTDGLDNTKRARLGARTSGYPDLPPLPPGPTSFAQLYTLTSDEGLTSFDVQQLPIDLIVKITLPVLYRTDHNVLGEAINGIRSRYVSLSRTQQTTTVSPLIPPTSVEDDDDDEYEPDFEPTEDTEQVLNKIDNEPSEPPLQQPEMALGSFTLPQPPPLTEEETEQIGKGTLNRVFSMMNVLDDPSLAKRQKPGLNRLAASNYDREAWITVITRLATRASAGLDMNSDEIVKSEDTNGFGATKPISLSDSIRQTLYLYVVEDFRARISIAIAWLNEEWYNDRIQIQQQSNSAQGHETPTQHYEHWVLKVLDGIVPYLDAKDKVLIRFLSEIPGVSGHVLERVKGLARDPERVGLAVNALQ
jgi:symplekin